MSYQALSLKERETLLEHFNLSSLTQREKEEVIYLFLNYLDKFPILNMVARDLINSHGCINLKIKKCEDGIGGYQSGHEIAFNRTSWDKYIKRKDYAQLASTLWHELVHFTQESSLSGAASKRGKMVYRQFIEAEAMSYSNLLAPRSNFEERLYKAILHSSSSLSEAQKRYIAVSTRLRLNSDRELAKIDAQNIMGDSFSEKDWLNSEKTVLKDWQDFYYKYHLGVIKHVWNNKSSADADLMNRWENYFLNRYGLKISVKSAISKEVIDKYSLPRGIENTILVRTSSREVFDFNKWRLLPSRSGGNSYVLDMPNMDPEYVREVFDVLRYEGLKGETSFIVHSDGFSSRCVVLENSPQNNQIFLKLCQKYGTYNGHVTPPEEEEYPPVNPKDCKYNQTLRKGDVAVIDMHNLPTICVGKTFSDELRLAKFFTPERINFIREGGILVIGRNPHSKSVEVPYELTGKHVKGITLDGADNSVSKFHGYFFMKNGYVCYKDYSTNGTYIRPQNQYAPRQLEGVGGRS